MNSPGPIDHAILDRAFNLLAERLRQMGSPRIRLVVCGGSALIALRMVTRTTRDVDIVALLDEQERLIEPVPLPPVLVQAARDVAPLCGLAENWLNNGPSRGEGGLYQMGLPSGFASRLTRKEYGDLLGVYFTGRIDQIFFKLYAATDRGGRDITDLAALQPTDDEMEAAARWTLTNDVSEPFRALLQALLRNLGYEHVAERI